jgi:hypothetical protein
MYHITSDISRRQFFRIAAAAGAMGASAAFLAGCSSSSKSSAAASSASASASAASSSASASAASASASAAATRTIVDDAGRTVEIPAEIKKVAASGFGARAIIYAGAIDRLVGVSESDKRITIGLPYAKLNEKGYARYQMVCKAFFDPKTRQTYSEKKDSKPAKRIDYLLTKLQDEHAPIKSDSFESEPHQASVQTAPLTPSQVIDDAIPF